MEEAKFRQQLQQRNKNKDKKHGEQHALIFVQDITMNLNTDIFVQNITITMFNTTNSL